MYIDYYNLAGPKYLCRIVWVSSLQEFELVGDDCITFRMGYGREGLCVSDRGIFQVAYFRGRLILLILQYM